MRTRGKITRNYLSGWAAVDILSVMPIFLINFYVDQPPGMRCTPFGPEMPEVSSGDAGDAGTSSLVRATQTVRIVKLLRMLKLARAGLGVLVGIGVVLSYFDLVSDVLLAARVVGRRMVGDAADSVRRHTGAP